MEKVGEAAALLPDGERDTGVHAFARPPVSVVVCPSLRPLLREVAEGGPPCRPSRPVASGDVTEAAVHTWFPGATHHGFIWTANYDCARMMLTD